MSNLEPKAVIIYRETRLDELKRRYNTIEQARFYVESLGADFTEYVEEDIRYKNSLKNTQTAYQQVARAHLVERSFLTNYVFAGDEIVVVVGQDGLVANTLKYVKSLPVVGINPEPSRYDGILLPFDSDDAHRFAGETVNNARSTKDVTMSEARLSNGQSIIGVNDIFIGPKQHTSARYEINWDSRTERQSSSGIIISTGLGSTGWFQSLLAGATQIAGGMNKKRKALRKGFPWDSDYLYYCVREPFPSNVTGTELSFGQIHQDLPLNVVSNMPENGIIFSDGMIDDSIDFHSGLTATIGLANWKGQLMV